MRAESYQVGTTTTEGVRYQHIFLIFGRRRSDSVFGAVCWKTREVIRDWACFVSYGHPVESRLHQKSRLSAAPLISHRCVCAYMWAYRHEHKGRLTLLLRVYIISYYCLYILMKWAIPGRDVAKIYVYIFT